ncbi:uncharacterized protein PgNI_02847 [Pyricularia grisea]|uniref:Amidase domain-containing protein n=1 Tax=Pyricularia grisea TaxID=148305 RepID=A0A6P8BAY3_PYRGI|nr:uncharacterized protein PgNI_02847 [Pyricularia grisea]TLD12857.1 hypothetical protein PgNI_02847 [Pyricularia grisea]
MALRAAALFLLATTPVHSALVPPTKIGGVKFPSLLDASIDDLAQGLQDGLFTSVDLVNAYLTRIDDVDEYFKSVTEINPDALLIAAQQDAAREKGEVKGPLHGIPILVKNNIATADKMNNTAGSTILLGAKVPRDSFVVKRLRQAGAIILGKANLSQWANYRGSYLASGWSSHGGQCLGAYVPEQEPSGSSSGSAVAAALGLAAGTLGTETDGSIISPSAYNSIVGIKTTVGLTSRDLVIPISEHQDTVGPMTRTVKDAAILLQAIAGVDFNDNYTSAIPGPVPNYVAACDKGKLKGARIGLPTNLLEYISGQGYGAELEAFYAALKVIRHAGAEIVDEANFTRMNDLINSNNEAIVMDTDFISNIATYLSQLSTNPNDITNLYQIRGHTQSSAVEEWPRRDTSIWDNALDRGFNNTDIRAWEAYQWNLEVGTEGGVIGALDRHNLDAIVLPTSWAYRWCAIIGCPVITVPLGFYPEDQKVLYNPGGLVEYGPGIPFGFAFLGRHFTEEKLIGMAYAFEQLTNIRDKRPPFIVPKHDIHDFAGKGIIMDMWSQDMTDL